MVAAGLKQKQPQFPQNSCDMSTPTLPTPVRILHLTPPLQEPESNKSPETPKEHERWEEDRAASGHLQGEPDPPTRGKPGLLFPLWAAGGTALCGGSQRPIKLIHSLPPPPPTPIPGPNAQPTKTLLLIQLKLVHSPSDGTDGHRGR